MNNLELVLMNFYRRLRIRYANFLLYVVTAKFYALLHYAQDLHSYLMIPILSDLVDRKTRITLQKARDEIKARRGW